MDTTIWPKYRSAGFRLIAVSTGLMQAYGQTVARSDALSFPVALDIEDTAYDRYSQLDSSTPPFPLGVLIDKQGIVRRIDTTTAADLPSLDAQIAALLAK